MKPRVRDRPCTGANFLVAIGSGDAHAATAGFSEVIFPRFTLNAAGPENSGVPGTCDPESLRAADGQHLILRRGATGALDLYAWWDKARRGKAPQRRTVKVELLAEDHVTVVMTWHFRNARPVSLSYSPLNALDAGLVMETLALAFDRVEMS